MEFEVETVRVVLRTAFPVLGTPSLPMACILAPGRYRMGTSVVLERACQRDLR